MFILGAVWAATVSASIQTASASPPPSALAGASGSVVPMSLASWSDKDRAEYLAYEQRLIASPTRDRLLDHHKALASFPHIAGTPGDAAIIETLAKTLREIGAGIDGWTVEVDEFYAYLPSPVSAELEIITPERKALELRERPLAADPAADGAIGEFAWLGYSGTGEATGEIVYANYGTKADFEQLKSLGVDLRGKIVLCRYGGNYRGYKVKFAEAAGAAGVLIYTDPGDSGFTKGDVYPAGSWANDCCIQRGSLLVTGYQGDPLTPGWAATKDAKRLDPSEVPLAKIPAQPIGYGAATEILARMRGTPLPESLKNWAGGVKTEYRLTGGPGLTVRIKVAQNRTVTRSANVVATLRGSDAEESKRTITIGCHHDAWNNGAADPTCGTIALLESARAFADQARAGKRPQRSVVFAAWGAEEMGLIGSSEYVEKHRADLAENGVAYLNLDMASMGLSFGASASPELKPVIAEVARVVPQARDSARMVADEWTARSPSTRVPGEPSIGDVGGGSDHVPFLMHAGVPSASLGAGGSPGTSYHSAYDTLPWYWKTVGDDYESAMMVTRMATAVAARFADAPTIPFAVQRARSEAIGHLTDLRASAVAAGLKPVVLDDVLTIIGAKAGDAPTDNTNLMLATRRWMRDEGIPGRSWFKNWYVSTDADSGYANWMMPGIRKAIDEKDQTAFDAAARVYADILR